MSHQKNVYSFKTVKVFSFLFPIHSGLLSNTFVMDFSSLLIE